VPVLVLSCVAAGLTVQVRFDICEITTYFTLLLLFTDVQAKTLLLGIQIAAAVYITCTALTAKGVKHTNILRSINEHKIVYE